MGKELIFENENMSLWYHNDTKIVHHKFHTFTHGEEFRNGLNKGLELLKKKRAYKWLSDDSENPITTKEDREWTASIWRPAVINSGWKYWAIVLPEQAAGKMAFKKIVNEQDIEMSGS